MTGRLRVDDDGSAAPQRVRSTPDSGRSAARRRTTLRANTDFRCGGVPVPREPFGFGGWNESRFGVGDITGKSSIEFWTKSKKMTTKWNKEAGVNWMS